MQAKRARWDARYFQIAFQFVFLSYGLLYLHWVAEWWLYATYFIMSIVTQLICELMLVPDKIKAIPFKKRFTNGLPSILITSFGLTLLLKTSSWYVAVFAAVVAILSKYIIRVKGKHIFNPGALGITAAISITGNAWFSPGQWGSGVVIVFAVLCLGFIVVTRVQKTDISLAFLGTFAGLLFIRQIIFLQWPVDFFVQSVSTGSLLLFSFFMITDPKTTPDHPAARIMWAMLVGLISFYLATFQFINGAPVWVLVCAQPLVPALDHFFKAERFEWRPRLTPAAGSEQTGTGVIIHRTGYSDSKQIS